MGRRKHKKKTRKRRKYKRKRICCAGPGCPEWQHCIHVLGDVSRGIRPKSNTTLKIIKKCAKRYSTYKHVNYKKCLKRERRKRRRMRTRRRRGGTTIVKPKNVDDLKTILIRGGISEDKISGWSKPLSKLLKEIKNGETTLILSNGTISRLVNSLKVKVYNNESKNYSLNEIGHYDKDNDGHPGQETTSRNNEGVLEKMMSKEKPQRALKRAITEELGAQYASNMRYMKGQPVFNIETAVSEEKDSHSYPGLPARYDWFTEEIYIPKLTEDTLNNNVSRRFFTEELKEDGSFKRFILWEWRESS